MRTLYNFLFYICIPFLLLRLLWRSLRAKAYRERWRERFGYVPKPKSSQVIWVHAVSLGETNAAIPIIKAIQQKYPQYSIYVTNMTPTGSARAANAFGDRITNSYIPYDLPCATRRFFKRVNPKLAIIMETELWPNLLYECTAANVPVLLANARLSTYSARSYSYIQGFVKKLLQQIHYLAAQTRMDARRFIKLGLPAERVTITGSVKFDIDLLASILEHANALRQQWGERPIWIAASTHEGEEEAILAAHQQVVKEIPDALLILVPRHPERFPKVAGLCEKKRFNLILRSQNQRCTSSTQIFLGDTMGELMLFYAASDLAFVAGSFTQIGGHNLLEPAALGKPVLTGPYMFNFAEVNQLLHKAGAAQTVDSAKELAQAVVELLHDGEKRDQMGQKGRQVIENNKGAVIKHLDLIEKLLR